MFAVTSGANLSAKTTLLHSVYVLTETEIMVSQLFEKLEKSVVIDINVKVPFEAVYTHYMVYDIL